MQVLSSISIAGAGNVAVHLGKALSGAGIRVDFIWSRSPEKVRELAALTGASVAGKMTDMQHSDVILCAVPDDALRELIPQLSAIAPVATTSGTVDVTQFEHTFPTGVFYPLQTFSRSKAIALSGVPLFVESADPAFAQQLKALGERISTSVTELPWEQRAHLHVAAVFVNNFTNHLVDIAQQHLAQHKLSFDLLKPLLRETVDKLDFQAAKDAQTGPARRNDQHTIQQHISMLPAHEAAIYKLLSDSIHQRFNDND